HAWVAARPLHSQRARMSGAPASPAAETGQSPVTTQVLEALVLRSRRDLPCCLIGAEAQERCDVAGAIQVGVLLEIEQFYVAADGDGDDGIADVGEFARGLSAGHA